MRFTPEGGLEPLLAESFEQTDEVTYVYTLREGITFSDGSPVTIDDVVASIARVRDPEVAGPLAWMYDNPGAAVESTDDKTITITLATPSALFRYVTATTAGHVIPAAAIEEFGLDLLRNPIGYRTRTRSSGGMPAARSSWSRTQPTGRKGSHTSSASSSSIVEEGTTRVTGLKNGEIDMLIAVPADQIDTVSRIRECELPGGRWLHDQLHGHAHGSAAIR